MKWKILSKDKIEISEVLIHIFGFDTSYFLSVAQKYSEMSKTKDFKMPILDVQKNYGISRHKQLTSLNYLIDLGIISVKEAEDGYLKEGRTFKFDSETISILNYLIHLTEDVKNYKEKLNKKIMKENIDIDAIIEKMEKYQ